MLTLIVLWSRTHGWDCYHGLQGDYELEKYLNLTQKHSIENLAKADRMRLEDQENQERVQSGK
jgi:hypothetical protein